MFCGFLKFCSFRILGILRTCYFLQFSIEVRALTAGRELLRQREKLQTLRRRTFTVCWGSWNSDEIWLKQGKPNKIIRKRKVVAQLRPLHIPCHEKQRQTSLALRWPGELNFRVFSISDLISLDSCKETLETAFRLTFVLLALDPLPASSPQNSKKQCHVD